MLWRVYLFGLTLLAVVALLLGISARLLFSDSMPWGSRRLAQYADVELGPLVERPDELARRLANLHDVFGFDTAVYRADGTVIAHAGAEPPPLAELVGSAPAATFAVRHVGHASSYAAPLAGGAAYFTARMQWQHGGFSRALLIVAGVLFALMLCSLPLARGIVRPIEQVTRTARALGAGDLSARTGLNRSDEVGELARAFDQMAERLERLVESEKELLANVSHELRTPLARIRVALELAEEDASTAGAADRAAPDRGSSHLAGISDDLRELEELVDNVLSTARLDLAAGREGRLAIEHKPVAPGDILRQSAARFESRHAGRRAELDIDEPLPEISGDARLLRRVLDNILDNAAKYADASAGPVEIRCTAEAGVVDVAVRDHGIGVPEADLPRLFEPFFRTDKSRERGTGGVGLGLTLCRRIVEAHEGTISAELPEDGGLRIRVRLPVASA